MSFVVQRETAEPHGTSRWPPSSGSHSHGHGSQASTRYEDYDIEGGPSQSKRRMRVSPHR